MHFKNRTEAGRLLAQALKQYCDQDVVVYAIPRGGVVVGIEIAHFLRAPLDLVITRKIGHPFQEEYAIAAVAEDGHMLGSKVQLQALDSVWLNQEIDRQRQEARRRREKYLGNRPKIDVQGKTAILVDDGIATGITLLLAIQELKHSKCKRIVVAVPVAPKSTAVQIKEEVDEFIALDIPEVYLGAVGAYYGNFAQVEDEEVIAILNQQKE